jgi:catechol 2,3-dioxygenase-like lactoylglutathione lyase family enzyme
VRLNHIMLSCADIDRALTFYRGMGLTPIVIDHLPDGATIRYARMVFPDGDATLSLQIGEPASPGVVIYFECDDLDARVAQLANKGYAFAARPETKPWLWREAELVDPDGHRLCLFQAGTYRRDPPWRLTSSKVPAYDDSAGQVPASFLSRSNHGYVDVSIPSARDVEIAAYLDQTTQHGSAACDQAATQIGPPYTGTFLAYAERMASLAVRDQNPQNALHGVLAIALTWRSCADVRPAVPILGLLYDAAKRAGANPDDLFNAAAAASPADVAPVLRDFLTRGDLDQIADEMGFAVGADRDGFRYRRLWGAGRIDVESDL